MRPRFVYRKKKTTASTRTAIPAEPNADKIPIRIPRPVDPPSLMLITIFVGGFEFDEGGIALEKKESDVAATDDKVDVESVAGDRGRICPEGGRMMLEALDDCQ